jgi:hypothetical protein
VVNHFGRAINPAARDIARCIFIRFAPAEATGIRPVSDVAEVRQILQTVYLGSRDPIYHNWHGYVTADEQTIEKNIDRVAQLLVATAPLSLMTWAPSAESLFKTLPELARAHNHLGQLLRPAHA